MKAMDVLVASAVILAGVTACANPQGVTHQQAQVATNAYCTAKAVWCALPNEKLSEDEKTMKLVACAVNTVCLPPAATASAASAQ